MQNGQNELHCYIWLWAQNILQAGRWLGTKIVQRAHSPVHSFDPRGRGMGKKGLELSMVTHTSGAAAGGLHIFKNPVLIWKEKVGDVTQHRSPKFNTRESERAPCKPLSLKKQNRNGDCPSQTQARRNRGPSQEFSPALHLRKRADPAREWATHFPVGTYVKAEMHWEHGCGALGCRTLCEATQVCFLLQYDFRLVYINISMFILETSVNMYV